MRTFLPAVLLTALLPTLALAAPQDASDAPMVPHGRMMHGDGPHQDGLLRGLKLTDEQRQTIGDLLGKERRQQHDIVQSYLNKLPDAEHKAMDGELKANREKTRDAIRAALTPEQQKRFDAQAQKREAHQKEWAEFQQWKKTHPSS